jgi:recombination protein RecR
MLIPEHIQRMIDALSRLPGVGPKTASRLTFYLLRESETLANELAEALTDLKVNTAFCEQCFNITSAGNTLCEVCASPRRDASVLCVVEEPLDVLALERTASYPGLYHVLHGVLSPIEGIGPEDIRLAELVARIAQGEVQEVIVATNPNMEGDSTANYIRQQLKPYDVRVTRLARGLPMGGDLEFADQSTLSRALDGRQEMG